MTREQAEKKIIKKLKEIEKIARKYTHNRNGNMSISIREDGSILFTPLDWWSNKC